MTIRAYDSTISKASRALGAMLHDAVYQFGMGGGVFLGLLSNPALPKRLKSGSPKYIAGKKRTGALSGGHGTNDRTRRASAG